MHGVRKIEELMLELKEKYTIAIVTHNLQQAQRVADHHQRRQRHPQRRHQRDEQGVEAKSLH